MTAPTDPHPRAGLLVTLKSALLAALACGALFGLIDALIVASTDSAELAIPTLLGCLAGSIFQYTLVWTLALLLAAVLFHPLLSRRDARAGSLTCLRLALLLGLFLELYGRSQPYVFYGRSAFSAERLIATAAIALVALLSAFAIAPLFERGVRRFGTAVSLAVLAIAVPGGTYLALHGGSIGARGVKNDRTRDLPNVLLVVVDALRQDTLGCYGNTRIRTPNIDRLAREGVLFENAFTQAPFTWTSFGCLLTGKYPRRHGLVKMAAGVRMSPNITLPFHLKQAEFAPGSAHAGTRLEDGDYVASTFHTGTLTKCSGLLRGFDLYYQQMAGRGIVVADSAWSVFRSDLLLHVVTSKANAKIGADVGGVARGWLDAHADRRFVAMVHLYSTHTPYDPEREFHDMYADPRYAGPFENFYACDRQKIESGEHVPDAADLAQIRSLYAGGVSQADDKIGVLLETLRARGILDDTLVVVMSDHGESLGENGLWEHNHMVQTNLRIPLLMRWPRQLPAGVRVKAMVDEIDLVPTVCDLMGLAMPREALPYGTIDGRSLVPLVRGTANSVREYSFAENGVWLAVQDTRWKLVVPADALAAGVANDAARTQASLIDLAADPDESSVGAFAAHPVEGQRLLTALRAWSDSMPIPRSEEVRSERELEEVSRRLDGIGYAGASGAATATQAPRVEAAAPK